MIVKGVASYGAVSQPSNHGWMSFASIMAASVAANILADPYIFQGWPHYNPGKFNYWKSQIKVFLPSFSTPLVCCPAFINLRSSGLLTDLLLSNNKK